MSKQVKFGQDARNKIRVGIDTACSAIRTTIGPKGRNAFIDNEMQPRITNDGVTIANSITLEDKLENMGCWLVKNTSSQTNEDAGDGTSTTAVLLKSIIDEASKRNESPMEIKRELMALSKTVVKYIKDESRPVKKEQIESVATISSESPVIGKLIADVIAKVGKNVPVTIEDNQIPEIEYEVVEGVETHVGFMHNAFITNQKMGTCEMENVLVFCTDRRIGTVPELRALFEMLQAEKITSLVMLVSDIDNSVLGNLLMAKMQGQFNPLIIKVKGSEMEDMAAACNAVIISEISGIKFADIKMEHLGMVKRIVADDKKTLIVNDSARAKAQASFLRGQMERTKNHIEKAQYELRANRLEGGVAIIKVGAHTDSEREYQKYKIEDAVNATKSALEEGLVEGGGMCLYRISNKFKGKNIGEDILRVALKEPLKAIIENCGEDYASIVRKLPNKKGYDASTGYAVDMYKAGIVDPAKVTRCAFENAISTAANFITAEVAIADENKKETK